MHGLISSSEVGISFSLGDEENFSLCEVSYSFKIMFFFARDI